MTKKSVLMRVTPECHKKIKVEASKEGKTIMGFLDDRFKVDKEISKNYKSKEWGKLF